MSRTLVLCFAFVGLITACDKKGGDDAKSDEATAAADKIWKERCVACHGENGAGDGAGAAALAVKPANFSDPTWQSGADDAKMKKVIVEGGAAAGLNAAMAPNPDLKDKPDVVDALAKKIRKMAK